jgi:hypothetical protein
MFAAIVLYPAMSMAQFNIDTSFSYSNELNVEIIPTYPKPNDTVFINLTLYTGDLNSAEISWVINGRTVLSGTGKTSYSFKMGPSGAKTTIEIRVKLRNGASFSKSFTLNPANLDLVWEANTYVPPFYKGKALHSRQGSLRIVAMPEFIKNGVKINPENLIYSWANDVESYLNQSGYGRNTIALSGSILGRDESIRATVSDLDGSMVAEAFIDIAPVDTEIVLYESDPYYGFRINSAVSSNFSLKSNEVQIYMSPFYFSKENLNDLPVSWRLNGAEAGELSGSRTAVFRKTENEAGRSSISITAENPERILQMADASFMINFEK